MLLPENSADTPLSAQINGTFSNMPTRRKPRVVPSFPGLGLTAPVPTTIDDTDPAPKGEAVAGKAKRTKAPASKPSAAKSIKTASKVAKPTSKTIVAARREIKAKPAPTAKSESEEEDQEVSSSGTTTGGATDSKGRSSAKATAGKRKTNGDVETDTQEDSNSRPAKRAKITKRKAPPKPKAVKPAPPKVVINNAPTVRLDVYVCGEGSAGELGLGNAKGVTDVKRPRLNPHLKASEIGVVHVATGGMHAAALTHDNRILTWGVNDQGALGRDTNYEGGLRNIDDDAASDSSEDSNDIGLNPREATPTAVLAEAFPVGTTFTQLAAGDSCTFALTDDGFVYGWGTFRVSRSPSNVSLQRFSDTNPRF